MRLCGSFIPCALWVSACPGVGLVGTCTCAPQLFTTAWQRQVQAAQLRGPAPMAVARILLEPLQHQHLHTAQVSSHADLRRFFAVRQNLIGSNTVLSLGWQLQKFFFEGFSEKDTDVPGHPSSPSRALSGVSVSAPLATLGNCVGHWWPRQQSGADGDLDQVLPVGFLPEDEGRAAEPPNPQLFSTSGLILCV